VRSYSALKPVEASVDRVLEILAVQDSDITERPGATPLRLTESGAYVRIEEVTFGYQEGRPVIHNVSLTARPNSVTALVGATGAGKSTLVSLIPRFFDPWEGRVTIEGQDIRNVQIASLREHIALVLQEPFLFSASVADNIAYGRPGAMFEEIVLAARAANADSFIRQLPNGYGTILGERGSTLSGGERQRINIARALLKDAPILILDEPTSALDSQTETLVQQGLERLMEGRTTLVIAHRLSTVRSADQIVFLEGGKVVESGSPGDLLKQRGPYHRLHSLQFGGGIQEITA
jgi:ATP-binding cassette, subfamily B, bacterial